EVADPPRDVHVHQIRVNDLDLAHVAVGEPRAGEVGHHEVRAAERGVAAVVVVARRPSVRTVLWRHLASDRFGTPTYPAGLTVTLRLLPCSGSVRPGSRPPWWAWPGTCTRARSASPSTSHAASSS